MGIQLNKLYGGPSCTPSRSSLMTGKYASTLGLQHEVHFNDQPYGLGLNEKTIGDHMRRGGYRTHLIGKWNMGLFEKRYTPVYRGFDSHFGYLGGVIDYYNHSMTFVRAFCFLSIKQKLLNLITQKKNGSEKKLI